MGEIAQRVGNLEKNDSFEMAERKSRLCCYKFRGRAFLGVLDLKKNRDQRAR